MKMLAQGDTGAESGAVGDQVDGPVSGLQQVPGQVDALADEPLAGLVPTSLRKRRVKVRRLTLAWAAMSAMVRGSERRSMTHACVGAVPGAVGSGTGRRM
jgi:hypothetical protein